MSLKHLSIYELWHIPDIRKHRPTVTVGRREWYSKFGKLGQESETFNNID